ncbi:MAG: hypothetical protein OEY66_02355 [Gammaproteobacteria bacterium]|nr:hypothetical protein [Gammaproteobacteria bacterium]
MKTTLLNNFQLNTITSITELYRNKANGAFIHAGLKLQLQNGEHLIFHTLPGKGPHLSHMNDFLDNNNLISQKVHTNNLRLMKDRIYKIISEKKSYTPLYNCEHLVSDVVDGIKHSPQLKSLATGAAVGVGIGYVLSKNKFQGAIIGGILLGYLNLQYRNSKL